MTYIITSLCLRDGSCVDVCPVECIIPGKPVEQWPWFYIDPDVCIDCGACIPECPYEAIFPEEEVPADYVAKGGEVLSMPQGTAGYDSPWEGKDEHGEDVKVFATRVAEAGEEIDFSADIPPNYDYFTEGMGYKALDE